MNAIVSWMRNASWFSLGLLCAGILLFGVIAVQAATTISTDIVTGGSVNATSTLAVGSVATIYGNLVVNGNATTTAASGNFATAGTITSVGAVWASSTLQATGATRLYGATTVDGAIWASSTLQATGDAVLYGGSGALTLTTTNAATSSLVVGCIQTYATSTATPIKFTIGGYPNATTTYSTVTAASGNGYVTWNFGSCS